jgi:serine/threonine protein phosphatase PrpC
MEAIFRTDRGKVRQHNEDNGGVFFQNENLVLAVVADGMGGHQAGDVASEMTVNELERLWQDIASFESPEQAETWLKDTIQQVNQKLFTYASEHEECQGMGTTLVASICTDEFVTVGHIGDSRCYLQNSHGLSQITSDHSLVNELVRSGQISKEDAEYHPRKNVLMRALGTESDVHLDITTIEWEQKDSLLLCSDGLTNKVSDEELGEFLGDQATPKGKAQSLINRANELGGEDNISVAIVAYKVNEEMSDGS